MWRVQAGNAAAEIRKQRRIGPARSISIAGSKARRAQQDEFHEEISGCGGRHFLFDDEDLRAGGGDECSAATDSRRPTPVPVPAAALAAFVLAALGMHQLLILVLCGAVVVLLRLSQPAGLWVPLFGAGATTGGSVSLLGLFSVFLKIGAIVFGSGYVLLAFLQADLVDSRHWLTSKQLLDAVAVGQVTPGPVFTTATFIGFLLAGTPGAIVATIAIFLPGFVLVAISGPYIVRIRKSPTASAFLDGVTVASIALIAWVLIVLGRATLVDPVSIGIAVASFVLMVRFGVNAAWLIVGAGVLGAFTH